MPLNRKLCTPLLGTDNLLFYNINMGSPHLHSNDVPIHAQPQDRRACRFSQTLCNTAKMIHTVLNLMCIKLESVHGTNMHTLDTVITSQKFGAYRYHQTRKEGEGHQKDRSFLQTQTSVNETVIL